jgi:type I restriction enzyme R subunit
VHNPHRWQYSPDDSGHDRERALFGEDVFGWLADTQPEEFAKVLKRDTQTERAQVLDRLVEALETPLESGGGTLNVLRNGFAQVSARLDIAL